MLSIFQSVFAQPRDLLLIIIAAWIGLMLAERQVDHYRVNLEALSNLLLWSLGGFILGGRFLYAIEHLSVFVPSPLGIFSFNLSLFDPLGGLAIALITAFIYGQHKRLSLWSSLDALTPFLATLAVGISLSHLATGQAFGQETNVPWAIEQWGALRQPTQSYEIIASLTTLLITLFQKPPIIGHKFLLFAALTAASQLIIEGFHGDNILIFNGLRLEQVIAWIGLVASLFGLEYLASRIRTGPIAYHPSDTKTNDQVLESPSDPDILAANAPLEKRKPERQNTQNKKPPADGRRFYRKQ